MSEPQRTEPTRIILVDPRSGKQRTVSIGRAGGFAVAGILFALLAGNAALVWQAFGDGHVGTKEVVEWRTQLDLQSGELEAARASAERHVAAIARHVGLIEARLARVEALGTRVAEVARLEDEEFDFSSAPALGGPSHEARGIEPMDAAALTDALDRLSASLRTREQQLRVLEDLLDVRDHDSTRRLAGRPVSRGWISSPYGKRIDPLSGQPAWHAGIDFAGREGSDVLAVGAGAVTFAGRRAGYGLLVEIDHGDGWVTRYGHQKALLVDVGDLVRQGQAVGQLGSTGRSTGPHVHFEVLENGRYTDPSRFIARTRG